MALPRLLSACSWPFLPLPGLPHAPSGTWHLGAPCTRVHQCMDEAEQPGSPQNLGSPPAWLLKPSGVGATGEMWLPSQSSRPYSSSQDLQPTLARAGFAPARVRTRFPRLTGCTNAPRNALPPTRMGLRPVRRRVRNRSGGFGDAAGQGVLWAG